MPANPDTNPYMNLSRRGDTLHLGVEKLYKDADAITSGACNPVAVAGVLMDMIQFVSREVGIPHDGDGTQFYTGTEAVKRHPAIRTVLDHLNVIVLGANHPEVGLSDYGAVSDQLDAFKAGRA